jgi:hypothetical protein
MVLRTGILVMQPAPYTLIMLYRLAFFDLDIQSLLRRAL